MAKITKETAGLYICVVALSVALSVKGKTTVVDIDAGTPVSDTPLTLAQANRYFDKGLVGKAANAPAPKAASDDETVKTLQAQVDTLTTEKTTLEREKEALEKQVSDLTKERDDANILAGKAGEQIAALEAQVETLTAPKI